ncbi:tripartite tricarboxylate transporter TctA family protein [Sporolactobacillus sp. THM7-4]|nr:tripartite tricarboxylate transporter TctA family protein [Sporolactobacillus sp. THM7-4]
MDLVLIAEMIGAAIAAAMIYTIIGIIPGTDETAVLVPVTLILVLAGVQPIIILCFFISAIIANNLMDAVPAAVAGIPGGVMTSPMVEHAQLLKKHGLAGQSLRKMAAGSLIGVLVSVPVSLLLASRLIPLAHLIQTYANPLFFIGAIILALLSKNKALALASTLPFALLIEGMRHLYWGVGAVPRGTTVFISFFLGITIGPVILTLFELLDKKKRESMIHAEPRKIVLRKDRFEWKWLNPFKIVNKREWVTSGVASLISCFTFILSPVGVTIFLGELFARRRKNPVERSSLAIVTMNALANATYISGALIPLIALGIPLSPVAIGPAHALFDAPPVFTATRNMHHLLTTGDFIWATVIGAGIAIIMTYVITVKYAQSICAFVFKHIPHEAILGLFCGFVLLLAYMDAGWINIGGVLLIGLVAGMLHRWGVNYGILFMTLYAAPWLVGLFG